MIRGREGSKAVGFVLACVTMIVISALAACGTSEQKLALSTEYQAVFLDNGQVFFGRMENTGGQYLLLKDVFYVQSQVGPDKQVSNILVKRGNEWHRPTEMHVNRQHIVVIEPVAPDSRVAQLIKEAKAQAPAPAK